MSHLQTQPNVTLLAAGLRVGYRFHANDLRRITLLELDPEKARRKSELQRELIALYKAHRRAHGLQYLLHALPAGVRRIERELLALDPRAVLYRSWGPIREEHLPTRRKADNERACDD